jgi:hypothetical protein
MRRAGLILLVTALAVIPGRADAAPIVTQQQNIVDHLRTDPTFITDQVPRLLTPSVVANVRAIIAQMPVPTYLMVVNSSTSTDLVPIVHDRLGRDGVYVALTPDGLGASAEQYGAGKDLQVKAAADDLTWTMSYDAGLVRVLGRFVADVRSGRAAAIEAADYKRHQGRSVGDPPDPSVTADRWGLASGAVLGVALAALLLWWRGRVRGRRAAGLHWRVQ